MKTEKNKPPVLAKIDGPEPLPKVGDLVAYLTPVGSVPRAAKVTAVYDGLESRVLDLEVDSGKGVQPVKSSPWRDAADRAGNTWHWPE